MLVDINLLPEKERDRSTLLLAALALIAVAILSWLIIFLVAGNYAKQSSQLEQQLVTLTGQQLDVSTSFQVSEFEADKRALASTVMWAEHYQFDTVSLLAGLVRLLPERGFFDEFEFNSPNTASLMVQFNTTSEAAYYLTRLQAAEFIDEVSLVSVVAQDMDDLDENAEINHEVHKLPRYLAVYEVRFFDERLVVESPVEDESLPIEDDAPSVEEESPSEGSGQDD